jgi:hypothetical protein
LIRYWRSAGSERCYNSFLIRCWKSADGSVRIEIEHLHQSNARGRERIEVTDFQRKVRARLGSLEEAVLWIKEHVDLPLDGGSDDNVEGPAPHEPDVPESSATGSPASGQDQPADLVDPSEPLTGDG